MKIPICFYFLFFQTELRVIDDSCVDVTIRWGILKKWQFYMDFVSLVVPLVSYITKRRRFTLLRLLRLRLLYDFHEHFCKGFQVLIVLSFFFTTII